MSVTCCPLSSGDDCGPEYDTFSRSVVKAAKEHRCCECGEAIAKGTKHDVATGKWDGTWDTYRTCFSCLEIRNHFACDGFIYGQLWEDIEQNFFPDMTAGGPCMEGLTPAAKARLFEARIEWLTENADVTGHRLYQDPR